MPIDGDGDGGMHGFHPWETTYALYRATLDPLHIRCHEAAYDPSTVPSQLLTTRDGPLAANDIDDSEISTRIKKAADIGIYLADKSTGGLD